MNLETEGRISEPGRHLVTGMIEESYFAASSDGIELLPNEVQVWFANPSLGPKHIEQLFRTLSPDEQDRARRFHFEKDRVRFIAARGILRHLLAAVLKTTADNVRFECSEYGKPSLSDDFSSAGLKFNVSHSAGKVLIALSLARELGVDIEEIRPDFTTEEIAERYFSPVEVATFRSLPENVRAEAFFNCWTRKEAYIKAIGKGLSCPLDQFDVTLAPGEPAVLLETRNQALPASAWAMRSLDAGRGYKAALVVEGYDWILKCRRWPEMSAVLQMAGSSREGT